MSLLSGLTGLGKIASNFLGGGAGDSVKTSGSQNQNQTSTVKQTGQNTAASNAAQSQNNRQFSDNMLQVLELVTKDSLGSAASGGSALRDRLDQVSSQPVNFDSDSFIRGVMDAANSTVKGKLTSDINGVVSSTGGSTSGNSASALLASRLTNDAASNLAGVRASAGAQAAEIQSNLDQSRTGQLTSITQGMDATLTSLLSSLKGGESQIDINGSQSEASNSSSNQNTTGNSTVSSTENKVQPFNWQKGFGNIFNIDTDK